MVSNPAGFVIRYSTKSGGFPLIFYVFRGFHWFFLDFTTISNGFPLFSLVVFHFPYIFQSFSVVFKGFSGIFWALDFLRDLTGIFH